MKEIRVGIIGIGYWGPNLVRNFVAIPDANVVVVADTKPERLVHIKSLYPEINTTENYREFFGLDLDAVVIATPPATHYPIAKDCLEHGLHTFVEKPITLNSADALTLIDLAQKQHVKLMVGHTFEYNPAVRKIKEFIDNGDLGSIHYINTERLNLGLFQSDLDVLWDLAPHDISILIYILGMEPIQVSASGGECIFKGKYDIAFLHLVFPENIIAHVHVSWLDPCKTRRTTVVGSKKMLVYDDVESLEKIRIYDKGVEKPPYTDSYGEFRCSYRYGDVVIPYIQFTEPLRIECQHFIDCIKREDQKPLSCGNDGLKVVRILEAAEKSIQNGGGLETIAWDFFLSRIYMPVSTDR